jgi:hypothetical protein
MHIEIARSYMSFVKLISATALAITFSLMVMPSEVTAQTMTQEQELNTNSSVSVTCTGGYGQSCTANANASAHGRQYQQMNGRRIVYRADGTPVVVHDVVNTGLDASMLTTVAGTTAAGLVAAVVKIKNRAK